MPRSAPRSPREAAVQLLARREHSFAELERKLGARFDARKLREALAALRAEGLQSDARFALSFVRERMLRGMGPARIRSELHQRGVSDKDATHALAAVPAAEGTSWPDLARSAQLKKFGTLDLGDDRQRARVGRFLEQRGFSVAEYPD